MSEEEMVQLDDQEQAQEQAEPNGMAATEPNGKAEPEDADYWKSRSRNWERQFKELKASAEENAEAKQHAAEEAKRADDAEAALAAATRELAVLKAAKENGVDADLLARMSGDTPEAIGENARALAASIKAAQAYPAVEDNGSAKRAPMTLSDIDAIKDDAQRRAAYASYYERHM